MNAVHFGIAEEQFRVWLFSSFLICSEGFDGEVQANFVSVFETVGDGFLRRIDAYLNSIAGDEFDAGAERRLGKPEFPKRWIL